MQRLQKFVPDQAHLLFGAAVDPAMGESLSITLISALPEDALANAPRESLSKPAKEIPLSDFSQDHTPAAAPPEPVLAAAPPPSQSAPGHKTVAEVLEAFDEEIPPVKENVLPTEEALFQESVTEVAKMEAPAPSSLLSKFRRSLASSAAVAPSLFDEDRPFAEPEPQARPAPTPEPEPVSESLVEPYPEAIGALDDEEDDELVVYDEPGRPAGNRSVTIAEFVSTNDGEQYIEGEPDPAPIEDDIDLTEEEEDGLPSPVFNPIPRKRPPGVAPWVGGKKSSLKPDIGADIVPPVEKPVVAATAAAPTEPESPKLKLGVKPSTPQSELSFDSAPRGRFEGEGPNIMGGEDLDLPPFLRKKK
jgi:hypothetical protein